MNVSPSLQEIQSEVDEFLTTQPGLQGEDRLRQNAHNLLQQYSVLKTIFPDELPKQSACQPAKHTFGIFNQEDARCVAGYFSKLLELAKDAKECERLDLAVKASEIMAVTDNIALAKYVLMLFIVHDEQGRKLTLPSYVMRHSGSLQRKSARRIKSCEDRLNWFREDLFLNEHHEHWHAVYGWFKDKDMYKDRHGELFLYMHQQMLARYNTERLAAKLPEVVPFPQKQFDELIAEGYDPGLPGHGYRNPKATLYVSCHPKIEDLELWSNNLCKGIKNGKLVDECKQDVEINEDVLGAAIEGNAKSVNKRAYGDLHQDVHVMIDNIVDDGQIMADANFSANDPVFYRWHKYIDDMLFAFQETQDANAFAKDAPDVWIRSMRKPYDVSQSPDIILCLDYQLENARRPRENLEQLGERLFGSDDNWDKDFSGKSATTTDELYTWTDVKEVDVERDSEPIEISYLDLAFEYTYFIRVQNLVSQARNVTVRIWLVAKYDLNGNPLYENRRMWIEMDTFQVCLEAKAQKVICRPAKFSSVVKKSGGVGIRPRTLGPSLNASHSEKNGDAYCDCGWPYNLLLPKGTPEGMDFRLMVMFTENDINMQGVKSSCGSVSLCGLWDKNYPDSKKMGYPFHRPFPHGNSIERTIFEQPNMAARDLRITYWGS